MKCLIIFMLLFIGCTSSQPRNSPTSQSTILQPTGQIATAIDKVKAEISALHQEVGEQIVALKAEQLAAGRDIQNWDKWAIYLLIALPFITYILPKILWVVSHKSIKRCFNGKDKLQKN